MQLVYKIKVSYIINAEPRTIWIILLPQYFLEIHIDSLENQAYENTLVRSGEEKVDGDGDFTASNKTDQDSGSRSSSNRQQEHI